MRAIDGLGFPKAAAARGTATGYVGGGGAYVI